MIFNTTLGVAKTRLRKCFLIKCLRARGLDIIQLLYQIKMPSWPLKYKGRRFPSSITEQSRPAPLPPPPQHEESSAAAAHRPTVPAGGALSPAILIFHLHCIKGNDPCQSRDTTHVEAQEIPCFAADLAVTNVMLSLGFCLFN